MIGFVRGKVFAFGLDWVLIDVNGIGYRINFYHPESLKKDSEITIFTYQNVREDEISLYGFLSLEEYDLFMKLISVKGLGPKIASGILAKKSIESIINAIEEGDVTFIQSMPGIGKKTASQIILDLKGKLVESSDDTSSIRQELSDVSDALKAFGYKPQEIKTVIKKLSSETGSTDELIKKALSMLMK